MHPPSPTPSPKGREGSYLHCLVSQTARHHGGVHEGRPARPCFHKLYAQGPRVSPRDRGYALPPQNGFSWCSSRWTLLSKTRRSACEGDPFLSDHEKAPLPAPQPSLTALPSRRRRKTEDLVLRAPEPGVLIC